jgi:hypothetical protein
MIDVVYSTDKETFHDYDYIMDVLRDEYETDSKVKIYKGKPERFTHASFVDGRHMIEDFMERAYEDGDEWAESYLQDVTGEPLEELERLVVNWLEKNAQKPNFYRVDEIEEIIVTVG